MESKIQNHKELVLRNAPKPQITTNQQRKLVVREDMEVNLRDLLMKTLKDAQQLPELMHGVMLMQAAGNFAENLKVNYPKMRNEIQSLNEEFLNESEFNELVDEVTSNVLSEFIDLPSK